MTESLAIVRNLALDLWTVRVHGKAVSGNSDPSDTLDLVEVAASRVSARFAGLDTIDVAIGLRIWRLTGLLANLWGRDASDGLAEISGSIRREDVVATAAASRFLTDLDRQDLVELLTRLTVGLGDLPGANWPLDDGLQVDRESN